MYYFDRQDGLKSIAGKTDVAEEQEQLAALCNAYWDISEGKVKDREHLPLFRAAAHHPQEMVWDWSLIGIMKLAEFHPPFRDLFAEMLLQDDQHIRFGIARHLHEAGDGVVRTVIPTMLNCPDVELRQYAVELIVDGSGDVSAGRDALALLERHLKVEATKELKSMLKKQIARLRRVLARSSRPGDVLDWATYQPILFTVMNEAINRFAAASAGVVLRAGCLDCNSRYGQVLLSFDAQPANDAAQEHEKWDIGSWSHFDVASDIRKDDGQFSAEWDEVERFIVDKIDGAEDALSLGPNVFEEQFMAMAGKVAMQLANSDAVKSLTTTEDFEFVAVDHDEPIETALRRMRQLSGS